PRGDGPHPARGAARGLPGRDREEAGQRQPRRAGGTAPRLWHPDEAGCDRETEIDPTRMAGIVRRSGGRPGMRTVTDQMRRTVEVPALSRRIISLVPSQTELLFDLGLGDRVVGITKFCIHPDAWFRSKPRVGGTKQVDLDKVRALRPDLIIGNKEENARADIEALEQEFPVWMSDVRDLNDALDMIRGLGALTDTSRKAEAIAAEIDAGFS